MILSGVFLLFGVGSFILTPAEKANYDVTVQTLSEAGEGLDLRAVGELVKKAENAEAFEKLLNAGSGGVNNLDLNEDGKVDYISVTEYGTDTVKGFSLTTQPAPGETQEIATIEIEKKDEASAAVNVKGNEGIYGRNNSYFGHFGITDMLLLGYLFRPHPLYASPWGFGSYPGGFRDYSTAPSSDYRNRMAAQSSSSGLKPASGSAIKSGISSPNAGKTATSIKAPLKNPTMAQKSFQQRNPSSQLKTGGFGRAATKSGGFGQASKSFAPSVRQSGFSRGGGSFGGK